MTKLQWFNSIPKEEIFNLIRSVDTILFDIDGVLLHNKTYIEGSVEAVSKLRALGKKIAFVTNNSSSPIENVENNIKVFGANLDNIITPNHALLAYLKETDFKQDIYKVGSTYQKQLLSDAGYSVINFKDISTTPCKETVSGGKEISCKALEICKNVGLVHLDLDLNCTYGSLQVAQTILNHNKNVKFVSGINDEIIPAGDGITLLGPNFYITAVEKITKQKAIKMGKPSEYLLKVVIAQLGISDPSRVLMVGDNPHTDIVFGVDAGFKTCLMLSGAWTKDQTENWKESEEFTPDYVGASLGELYEIIKDM